MKIIKMIVFLKRTFSTILNKNGYLGFKQNKVKVVVVSNIDSLNDFQIENIAKSINAFIRNTQNKRL